jgi:hypothetical protein
VGGLRLRSRGALKWTLSLRGRPNQNKHEAVLQGVATLCSKRPKESKTDDLGEKPATAQPQESRTTRARYSGAARSRYKKQLQREAEERAVQAGTQLPDEAANPPGTEEGGPSRASKRSRSDSSTPSLSGVLVLVKTSSRSNWNRGTRPGGLPVLGVRNPKC